MGGVLALGGALGTAAAHADALEVLHYQAPEACPSRAEFVAAVAARGGSFTGKDAAANTSFQVDIVPTTDGFHASLAVQNGAVTSNPREVRAPTCAEVVDALAVVTAIELNPTANGPVGPAAAPLPVPAPVPAAAPAEPPRPPLQGATVGWKKTLEVPAGKLHLDSAIEANLFFGGTLGIAPNRVLPRLDITFSRANFVTAPNGQSYLTGTVARMRASLLVDTTYRFRDIKAQVGGQEIGVGLCFSPHYDSAGWVLLGCAEISAGLIGIKETSPFGLTVPRDSTQGFGSLGLSLEASYDLGRHFQIGARVGAQTFTSRITAYHPTGDELFHSSPIIGSAVIGIGTHF